MVQVIDNRADIQGEVLASKPDPERPGRVSLSVRIKSADPVSDCPNLSAGLVGTTVSVPEGRPLASQQPGPARFRARNAGPIGLFAD